MKRFEGGNHLLIHPGPMIGLGEAHRHVQHVKKGCIGRTDATFVQIHQVIAQGRLHVALPEIPEPVQIGVDRHVDQNCVLHLRVQPS